MDPEWSGSTTELFDNLIVSLGYVVVLIIICAAALAAVVLYNLISVNLGERKKELATIKVLGFYDQEVYRYIFREIGAVWRSSAPAWVWRWGCRCTSSSS